MFFTLEFTTTWALCLKTNIALLNISHHWYHSEENGQFTHIMCTLMSILHSVLANCCCWLYQQKNFIYKSIKQIIIYCNICLLLATQAWCYVLYMRTRQWVTNEPFSYNIIVLIINNGAKEGKVLLQKELQF